MAWEFRYVLEQVPEAKNDGSSDVVHHIHAEGREDGGDWTICPARSEGIPVPAAELATALAAGTNGQIATAYKAALANNQGRTSEPLVGWSLAKLEQLMENNQAAVSQAQAAHEWITVTMGFTYPKDFVI